jgi:hypothetical protein
VVARKSTANVKLEEEHPQIEISCPHCGGASIWSLLQTLNQCPYCGSVLSWPYPEGEPDYLVAQPVIHNDSDLIEVLALYDAMREASLRRGYLKQNRSDFDPDFSFDLGAGFIDTGVYEIKRQRIHMFQVLKSICVYAPYQLIFNLLAFHVLGRGPIGQKMFQTLFFTSEAILPGYTGDWNFRDRGLHISKRKLKPLSAGNLSESFLATGAMTQEIEKITRQWTSQRKIVESEIHPISFQGKVLESHRWWVYRPYYFVNATTPHGSSWYLIDGQFGTIAGTPTPSEIDRIVTGDWTRLDLRTARTLSIRVIPFRCPNCGWDVKLKKAIYQVCDNCTRLLEVRENGLKLLPYETIARDQLPWWPKQHRGPTVWLPFWRLELSMLFEKKAYGDATELITTLVPNVKQNGSQKHIFIPAFDCWPVAKYDRWAFEFGAVLSTTGISSHETTIHNVKSSQDFIFPPSISSELPASLFPQLIAYYASSAVQARLSTLLINRLASAHVLLKHQRLVFVPAALMESRGLEWKLQGPKQSIDWIPLKEGKFPPMLQRTVRRWKAMGESKSKPAAKTRLGRISSALNKRL